MEISKKEDFITKIYRDKLISAYNNSTESGITADDLTIYNRGGYFIAINKDMKELLGLEEETPIRYHTYKSLVGLIDTKLTSAIRKNIDDYVKKAEEKKKINSFKISNTVTGAKLINEDFKREIEFFSKKLKFVDFYTSKIDGHSQWLGIVKDLDFKRPLLKTLEKELLIAIKSKRLSRVCGAIVGPHGIGKSTLLRRLAITCIKYSSIFQTLWIEDFDKFNANHSQIFLNDNRAWLLIIEDWQKITSGDIKSINTFFRIVNNADNIALIIADTTVKSEWSDYIYGRNTFKIELAENKDILSHMEAKIEEYFACSRDILTQSEIAQWREIINLMIRNEGLHESPIFIILFIVIRKVKEKDNFLKVDTEDLWSQFNSIIQKDYQKIYRAYPGLAKALYYWACVIEYNEEFKPLLTWASLLRLSDYYSHNNFATKELLVFNKKKDICNILSYYFSFQEIKNLPSKHKYFVNFHHGCIAEAMVNAPDINWYFEDALILEIAEAFVSFGMDDMAEQFLIVHARNFLLEECQWGHKKFDREGYFKDRDEYMNRIEVQKVYSKLQRPFKGMQFQKRLESLLTDLRYNKLADHEEYFLIRYAAEFYDETEGYKTANYLASLLIEKGFKSDLLKSLHEASNSKNGLEKFYYKNFAEADFI